MDQLQELTNNGLRTEENIKEEKHGIGWRAYFIFFILLCLISLFGDVDPISLIFGILHLVLSAPVLYSWIWGRRIGWLSKIRWLVKLWSIQFFIAPIALVFSVINGYSAFIQGDSKAFADAVDSFIIIVISYPALYGVYRIAWRSRLLYNPAKEAV